MAVVGSARHRDAGFLTFARQNRAKLFAAAYLLHGDAETAERLTQYALARAYGHRGHYLTFALEHLLRTDPDTLQLPWLRTPRVELVEVGRPSGVSAAIAPTVLSRLTAMPAEERRAVVARTFLALSAEQSADFLASSPERVSAAATRGLLSISDVLPAGTGDPAGVLGSAVPRGRAPESAALEDLAHGRWLVNRRRIRRGALVAAAVAAIVLLAAVVWPNPVTVVHVDAPATDASSTPSVSAAGVTSCTDLTQPECRVQVVRDWRNRMSSVVTGTLDPKGTYFSGYSYGYTPAYDSDQLWEKKKGALGLDLFNSRDAGGTVVFVQLATSRQDAIRCGKLTGRNCIHRQMMDFNYFTMTTTTSSRQGIEVQYCPEGTYVITLVARNSSKGTQFDVSLADLLQLVQDDRLRLPKL